MKKTTKQRLAYFCVFLALFFTEVLIALFVFDDIVRPFGGDVIVVWVIWSFVRIFIPNKIRLLPLWVFLFAVFIEVMQYINIVGLLGLTGNRFFETVMGTSFSFIDIGCYALGCAVLAVWEAALHKKKNKARLI